MDETIANNWAWWLQFGFMDHNYLLQLSRQKNKSIQTRRGPANGYEADLENGEKFYPPPPSKSLENVISEQETRDTSKPVKLTITQCYVSCKKKKKKLIYLVRVANGKIYMSLRIWLVIQVLIISCHRNFRKSVYIDFCYNLQFGKAKWTVKEWCSLLDLTTSHLLCLV